MEKEITFSIKTNLSKLKKLIANLDKAERELREFKLNVDAKVIRRKIKKAN